MKKYIPTLIIAVVVGAIAFYGGMQYAGSNREAARQQRGGGTGNFGGVRNDQGGVSGEILSADNQSITVKMRDGGSKIVLFSGSTGIMKSIDGTAADLAIGKNVLIMGSANADGSVTAESIQIRPPMPQGSQQVSGSTQTQSTQAITK